MLTVMCHGDWRRSSDGGKKHCAVHDRVSFGRVFKGDRQACAVLYHDRDRDRDSNRSSKCDFKVRGINV